MLEIIDLKIGIENFAKETQSEFPNKYFDYAGIIPVYQNWDRYECTPINVETFAHTGGDGVHFSLLNLSSDIKPVVMTVPCFGDECHENNIILSENLIEFLSLGYFNGWFPLEQIVYDPNWAINFYSSENLENEWQINGDIHFVKKLMSNLSLQHKNLELKRLGELKVLYSKHLMFEENE